MVSTSSDYMLAPHFFSTRIILASHSQTPTLALTPAPLSVEISFSARRVGCGLMSPRESTAATSLPTRLLWGEPRHRTRVLEHTGEAMLGTGTLLSSHLGNHAQAKPRLCRTRLVYTYQHTHPDSRHPRKHVVQAPAANFETLACHLWMLPSQLPTRLL
jgi:hypothetical protein